MLHGVILIAALASPPPFVNPGTPLGIPASYDCKVREHAWDFGKKTLPQRGEFKTLYDALQLQACGVPSPSEEDKWTPPTFPTPTAGLVIYTDSNAASGGTGSKTSPFNTLKNAVAAAKGVAGNVTIVLRAGSYHTTQILVTPDHNNLVIQNYEGEEAIVRGGIPVQNTLAAWSPYKVTPPHWAAYSNVDNVYNRAQSKADTPDVKYLGMFSSIGDCEAAAKNSTKGTFHSVTLMGASVAGGWANQCFGTVSEFWSPHPQNDIISSRFAQQNTWRLDVKGQDLGEVTGLRVGTARAVRAKYPNGAPEMSGHWYISTDPAMGHGTYAQGWITGTTKWLPPMNQTEKFASTIELVANGTNWPSVEWPSSEEGGSTWTGMGDWGRFNLGMNGFCSTKLSPPSGYWCSANSPRNGNLYTHMAPSGLSYAGILPQAANYSNPKGAVVQAWRANGRWYSNLCLVDGIDKTSQTMTFDQTTGCNNGGEGIKTHSEWWIENVKEECDAPGEYFYDAEEGALYYTFNGTETPTGNEEFVATQTKVIFNITGSQATPVRNVAIRGLVIRDAALTYLGTDEADKHGMPSGGDWALQRSGAVLIEGAELITIDNNHITRVDGNGVFLSNYNRNVTVSNNEFSWIGDTAMAAWGSTSPCLDEACSHKLPYNIGPDGRNGNQPRDTKITGNLVREIGIWQKQSAMWFQAVTSGTYLARNVHFNGPRAGVNFNDGFGGGDIMEGNLLTNCVRESGDHGPFNSWDRVPYITEIGMHRVMNKNNVTGDMPGHIPATGPTTLSMFRQLRHNFVLAVYASQAAIDNDDGSSHYLTHHNYFVYAYVGLKCDFGGQWNHQYNNVYGYVQDCFQNGNNDAFYNNLCQTTSNTGYISTCGKPADMTMSVASNSVHTPSGSSKICKGDNSTVSAHLSDDDLTAAATNALLPFPMSS